MAENPKSAAAVAGGARNPVLPLEHHIPDGEARVMPDGRLYVYGSYDLLADWYCSDRYRVASTANLREWTVHDVSFQGRDVPWFPDPRGYAASLPVDARSGVDEEGMPPPQYASEPLLYAPDAIERRGEYYLYFCMADGSEGVAKATAPFGPFSQPRQLPATGIDPSVFVDDDGQAYYYWGQLSAKGVRLDPSMTSFDPDDVVDGLLTESTHGFHEGSSVRKIGETYYFVFADGHRGSATCLGYATSDSPLGPFRYRGVIIDNAGCDPETLNNHGSIACVGGQWYVFYHRSSRGSRYFRRLCIEPIRILADGSIPEVPMTSQGVGEPFGAGEYVEGFRACELRGRIRIDVGGGGHERLCGAAEGDEAIFRYVSSPEGFSSISLDVEGAGDITAYLGGELVGRISVDGSRQTLRVDFERRPADRAELVLRVGRTGDLSIWGWRLGAG